MTPREAMLKALELAMTEKELMYALNVARQIFETFGKSEKLDELMQRILKEQKRSVMGSSLCRRHACIVKWLHLKSHLPDPRPSPRESRGRLR